MDFVTQMQRYGKLMIKRKQLAKCTIILYPKYKPTDILIVKVRIYWNHILLYNNAFSVEKQFYDFSS